MKTGHPYAARVISTQVKQLADKWRASQPRGKAAPLTKGEVEHLILQLVCRGVLLEVFAHARARV